MTDHMDEALDLFKRVWNRKDLDAEMQIEQVHQALQAAEQRGYERGRQQTFDQTAAILEKAARESGKAEATERAASIADGNFDNGIRRKIDKCAHDKYDWEDCNACVAAAIREAKP